MDCRGLEFVEFKADVCYLRSYCPPLTNISQGEWKATGAESGTKFTAIDLTEGEWFDYDEKAGEEVSIKDIKFDIKRA